ncbi:hypothetical protein [Streptomyces sp. NPDC058614]|uniref:hypothetical protein n=1 Tax=Streptomyces sp. NPDC058614 TaxID=3346557 RepID=UPI0036501312
MTAATPKPINSFARPGSTTCVEPVHRGRGRDSDPISLTGHSICGHAIDDRPRTGVVDPCLRLGSRPGPHVVGGHKLHADLGTHPFSTITAYRTRQGVPARQGRARRSSDACGHVRPPHPGRPAESPGAGGGARCAAASADRRRRGP